MAQYMYDYFTKCLKDIKKDIPKTWENVSYANDTCPSFLFNNYLIFIDHKNDKKRELQGNKRFHIINNDDYGNGVEPLLETDNFEDVLEFVNGVKETPLQFTKKRLKKKGGD